MRQEPTTSQDTTMSDLEDRLNRQTIRCEYVEHELFEGRVPIGEEILESTIGGTLCVLLAIGFVLYALNCGGIISTEHYPDSFTHSGPESVVGIFIEILYLAGRYAPGCMA